MIDDIFKRRPGESDDEFEFRRRVFTEGRLSIGVEDLPESVLFKWRLVSTLVRTMRDRSLDAAAAVAELAGEIEPTQIEWITRGQVGDVDSYEIVRLLKVFDPAL